VNAGILSLNTDYSIPNLFDLPGYEQEINLETKSANRFFWY